jgi:hypothetical protein
MGIWKDYSLFERTILKSAWENTRAFTKQYLMIEILVGFASAVGGLVTGATMQPLGQLEQLESAFVVAITTTFVAVVLMFVSIWLAYLITGPFRIWRQQLANIIFLQGKLTKKRDKEGVLKIFHQLADVGNELRVRRIADTDVGVWAKEVSAFREKAITMIGNHVSRTEAIDFNVTQVRKDMTFHHAVNNDHNTELLKLGINMDKLIGNIRHYEDHD